ncbi:MAG: hypothetical protein IID43_03245, partial [Planctomycetes bacterium]|nr:hypothetical protein [Planctomycetota bacterium]
MKQPHVLISMAASAFACAFAPFAVAQVPEGYEVVVLANDLGVHQRPGINNRSEVVWSSSFCPTANIYLYSEGRIRQISDGTMNDHWPDLNNVGMLAWQRGDDCFR